ncbi:helix-turn-helix domain-containing protein [Flavihumibacter rivuli]|uniref:AraC family transcriptional regulator n=1 Tax=Flavihumibacter rivuli TaxID=2838156 RepID=UPI001BDDF407|nr:helix-turn-helix domain-containing protein [Flavihumibacter rivuli]ULQ55250.1 helix-turn-helix domain-containing protein [Flavihumibacter rivuli]
MKSIPVRHIAHTSIDQGTTGLFSIRNLRDVLNGKDLVHELHRHDFFFVLMVEEGNGSHEIDFVPHKVHDRTIFLLRPGQVHKLELTAESTGFLMEFDPFFILSGCSLSDQRWKKVIGKNFCEIEVARFNSLQTILSKIFNEFTNRQDGYLEVIKASLSIFFIEFLRQSSNPNGMPATSNSYTRERFEELVRLLETNIGTMKNVSQYADMLNLSSYQLNAITKASVGKTVSDLINEQILLEAKRYLLATPSQVKEIADHLGYEDVSYFIRFFKKHTGQSPEAFRKNFK